MSFVRTRSGRVGRHRKRSGLVAAFTLAATALATVATPFAAPVAAVRTPGEVLLYNFSEGAGNTVFDSGVGTPLDLTIADPSNVTWVPGGGLVIDAATQIESPSSTKLADAVGLTNEITVEAWITSADIASGRGQIVSSARKVSDQNFTLFERGFGERYGTRIRSRGAYKGDPELTSPLDTAPSGALTQLVMTRDESGNRTIFVNGSAVASSVVTGDMDNWSGDLPFVIGNVGLGGDPFLGSYCRVAVYDNALDQNEIDANFAAGCVTNDPTNNAPDLDPIADRSNSEGDAVELEVVATDLDGDPLQFSADDLPDGLAINSSTGRITGVIAESAARDSIYSSSVTVADGRGGSDTETFAWTVEAVNFDPVLDSVGAQSAVEGQNISLQILASDIDDDTLSYSATDLPNGLSIDATSGLISGQVAEGATDGSPYQVSVTADDGAGGSDTVDFPFTIGVATLPFPVVRYDFAEGSGDDVADSGSGIGLDLEIANSNNVTWIPGGGLTVDAPTRIVSRDGSAKLVDAAIASGELTVEAWIAPDVTAASRADIIVNGTKINDANFILTERNYNDRYAWRVRSVGSYGGTPELRSDDFAVESGELTHIMITRDAVGQRVMYVDGVEVSTNEKTGAFTNWNPNHPLVLANTGDSGKPFLGSFCRVAFYDVAFTPGEVAATFGTGCQLGAPNTAPTIDPIPAQSNDEGDTVTVAASASDVDNDALQFSATDLPTGLGIESTTGQITGTIDQTAATDSPYDVDVTVDDGRGGVATTSFAWTVAALNVAPVFDDPGDQTGTEGLPVALALVASDADGDALTFGATGLPPDLSIDSATGAISGTIATGAIEDSPFAVTVTVDDGNGGSAQQTFTWLVVDIMVPAPVVEYSFFEGSGTTVNDVASGAPLNLTIADPSAVTWEPGGGLTVDRAVRIQSDGSATKVYQALTATGEITIEAWVSSVGKESGRAQIVNSGANMSNANFQLFERGYNSRYSARVRSNGSFGGTPELVSPDFAVVADQLTHVIVTRNADGDRVMYLDGVEVESNERVGDFGNWNPNYPLTLASINNLNEAFVGTFCGVAIYDVALTVEQVTANHASGCGTPNTPPELTNPADQTSAEGDVIALQIQATDADGDAIAFSATGLPDGLGIDASTGVVSGTVTQTAAEGSVYAVSVAVDDGRGGIAAAPFSWTIDPVNLDPTLAAIADQFGEEGDTVSVAVDATDLDDDALTFDASGLPSGVEIDPATGVISGTIDVGAATSSPFTVVVTVDDGQTGTGQTQFTWTVAPDVAPMPIVHYDFTEGAGTTVADSGSGAPLDLTIDDPDDTTWNPGRGLTIDAITTVQSAGGAGKVVDAVTASGEFTVEAWVVPAAGDQTGPARLVSNAFDSTSRNFMVGQGGFGDLPDDVFGMRSRTTGNVTGTPDLFTPTGSVSTSLTHVVATFGTDGTRTMYLDGTAVASDSFAGSPSNWDASYPLTLANVASGNRGWIGTLCDVAIYDEALKATDIADKFGAGCDIPNIAPTIDDVSPGVTVSVRHGETLTPITVTASDLNGTTPSLSTDDQEPASIGFVDNGDGTGVFSGLATAEPGSYPVLITATDDQASTDTVTITIIVTEAAVDNCAVPAVGSGSPVFCVLSDVGITDDAGSVTGWADQSTSGNDLVADVDAEPTIGSVTTPSGAPAVSFDGADDRLFRSQIDGLVGLPDGNDDRTMIVVAQYHDANAFGGVAYGNGAANQAFGVGVVGSVNNKGKLVLQGWGSGNDLVSGDFGFQPAGTTTGWMVQTASHFDDAASAADNATMFRDGAPIAAWSHQYATALGETTSQIVLGDEIKAAGHIEFDVAAVIVFDGALTPSDQAIVEGYLFDTFLSPGNSAPVVDDQTFDVAEDASNGDPVGTVVATDADVGDVLNFAIDGTVFAIDATTGEITVADASQLDAAVTPSYSLTVTVTDDGDPALSDTATIAIDVTEVVADQCAIPNVASGTPVLCLLANSGVTSVSGAVSAWADGSGQGNDVVADTVPAQPMLGPVMTPSGVPAIRFDGTDDRLVRFVGDGLNGLPAGNDDRTMIVVAQYFNAGGWGGAAFGEGASNQTYGVGVVGSGGNKGKLVLQGYAGDLVSGEFGFQPAGTTTGWMVQSAVHTDDGTDAANNGFLYRDGTEIAAWSKVHNTDLAGANSRIAIGDEIAESGHIQMDVAAVVVFDDALSPADQATIEADLAATFLDVTPPENNAPVVEDQTFNVPEGSPNGYEFGPVVATDPDVGDVLTYAISGTTFNIDGNGMIGVFDPSELDRDVNTVIVETVTVTDDGDPALSDTATITINVTEVGAPGCAAPVVGSGSPVFCVEADTGITAAGGTVTAWADLSGEGNDLDDVAGDPQINAVTTPSGAPAVSFDGAADLLRRNTDITGLPVGNSDRTMFTVVKYDSIGYGGFAYGSSECGQTSGLGVDNLGNLTAQTWCTDLRSTVAGNGAGWLVQSSVVDPGGLTLFADGAQIAAGPNNLNTVVGQIVIGAEVDGVPQLDMEVAAAYVFDGALDAADRTTIGNYLTGKFLTASNVPSVQVLSPADGATVGADFTVTWSGNEGAPGDQVVLSVDGNVVESGLAVSGSTVVSGLSTGDHTIELVLADSGATPYPNAEATSSIDIVVGAPEPFALDNFSDELVLGTGLAQPIALTFTPDGRMLLVEKGGTINIGDANAGLPMQTETYLDISNLNTGNERGVLAITLHPDFPATPKVYVYYTPSSPQRARISEFTHVENTGGLTSRATLASEVVLWEDTDGYTACCHYGGGLDFGPDGKLWLTVGDKFSAPQEPGNGNLPQDLTKAGGKIIRLNPDGSVPSGTDGWPGNFYDDGAGPNHDYVFAKGLRNPFNASWDLENGVFYIGEVGGNQNTKSWEDVHTATLDQTVFNYGWPDCEGPEPHTDFPNCDDENHIDPLFSYPHGRGNPGNASLSGGIVYRGSQFPDEWNGVYFFGDYTQDFIRYLVLDDTGRTVLGDFDFKPSAGLPGSANQAIAFEEGPDGSLYWVSVSGSVHRIVYAAGNQAPVITTAAVDSTTPGDAPATVAFTGAATDEENDTLTYEWVFGDGTTSSDAVTNHQYLSNGSYTAFLRVSDDLHTVVSDPITIQVGSPPEAVINSPTDNASFVAGDDFVLNGACVAEGTSTPVSGCTLSWVVEFGHDDHFHPDTGPVGGNDIPFEVPTSGHDFSSNTYFRITLTVTDPDGLADTDVVDILPDKVDLTFAAEDTTGASVPDMVVAIDTIARSAPFVLDTLKGFEHQVEASTPRCVGGTSYEFDAWELDGTQVSTDNPFVLTVPNTDVLVAAVFADAGDCSGPPPDGLVLHLRGDEGVSAAGGSVGTWVDQSSSGNDLSTVGGSGPALVTDGLNGRDYVSFDGIDDGLGRTGFAGLPTGAADRSVFMVVRHDDASAGWGGFSWGTVACNSVFGLARTNDGDLGVQGWCPANDFDSDIDTDGTGWMIQAVIVDGNAATHYRDGSSIDTFTHAFNTGTGAIRLGQEHNLNSDIDMDVAEILVYDRALSEAERQQIEDYLNGEYLTAAPTPQVAITAPSDGATITVDEITVAWNITGTVAGDHAHVQLDGQPHVTVMDLNGTHTFTGVADGPHTITVSAATSGHTVYPNPEATETVDVTVQVDAGDPAPIANDDTINVATGGTAVTDVIANDTDDGGIINASTVTIVDQPTSGSVSVGPDGAVTYVHDGSATTADSFTYTVDDEIEQTSNVATVLCVIGDGALVTDGLALHLEADAGVTGTTAVTAWADQTANGNDLIATGDTTMASSPTGAAAISLDGNGDELVRTAGVTGLPTGAGDRTMFLVASYTSVGAYGGAAYGTAGQNQTFGLGVKPGGQLVVQGYGGANDRISTSPGVGQGWMVQSTVLEANELVHYRDGAVIDSWNHAYNTAATKFAIGREIGNAGYIGMDVAAVLVFDRALTEAERHQVESYLRGKYLV